MKTQIIHILNDLKDLPELQQLIQEYEAKQERIGQPADLNGFLFENLDKLKATGRE